MGKPTSQPEPATAIQHFSHPHPLQLFNCHTQQTPNAALCSGCKLKASGWIYTCNYCNYFLHISCSSSLNK
ncbi:hypothetical protein Ddye_031940 [Dipteronia dyeriana]|uniref:DC1 domain-containing protein n=1 Tax=Dipteronia dyeriana TaxID=168575 RepID=A0AAD9TKA4_9ROSI|nr:hypothetical protein Ddye_031940 [Dipteronia dyeriana]